MFYAFLAFIVIYAVGIGGYQLFILLRKHLRRKDMGRDGYMRKDS